MARGTSTGDALFEVGHDTIYRVERRVRAAVLAGKHAGTIEDQDDGACIAAIALGRAIDRAERIKPDPYAVAAAARELREYLDRLLLTPRARGGGGGDPVAEALAGLAEPSDA